MTMWLTIFRYFSSYTGCDPNKTFFGVPVWYKYLHPATTNGTCDFSGFDPVRDWAPIGLAIVDGLLRIAGLVAVGFIFYAAINFITSQGNAEDAAKARGTAINALVGLVIVLVAIVFVQFIGSSLK